MAWNRKQPAILGSILFVLSAFLFLDIGYRAYWYLIAWPLLGMYTGTAFFRKDEDGFGGIIFHLFILYCAIYYLVLSIIDITTFTSSIASIIFTILNVATTGIAWFGLFMYYD